MSTEWTCPICGGIKPLMHGIVRTTPFTTCYGHPEPAPKHDGKLGSYSVEHSIGRSNGEFHYVRIQGEYNRGDDEISLQPDEALSLLTWLRQEEQELQRLAKEQGRGE